MAYVRYSDGESQQLSRELATDVYNVLIGVESDNQEAIALADKTERLYLDWRTAPDAYLLAKKQLILPMLLSQYVVNSDGKPMYPEPNDKVAWRVSYLFGIIPESTDPKEFVRLGYTGRMV